MTRAVNITSNDLSPAVLDANVLVPAVLRDTLLSAAERGLYRVHWTRTILDEVERTLLRLPRSGLEEVAVQRLIAAMIRVFPDAGVTGYEPLISSMTNDFKDHHVAAAAVAAKARVIVTLNTRHFPPAALQHLDVEAVHPDRFLSRLLQSHPDIMLPLLEEQAAALRRPSRSVDEVLGDIGRFAPEFRALVYAARRHRS